ncbi:hypothetical protein Gogos_021573 [Gossypium gossypioides]|uniref:Uncharacterized protein n=1 Tax=Gossypium gossypioides TaxID=34282 RepID=A0A7J9CZ06_GOSGO|nr:hypothetical protein [Gossypium gossypioides]
MIFEILILVIERFRNSFANSTRSFHLKYGLLQMSLLHGILGQFSINLIMKKFLKAIQEYYKSIPDPMEWSQDYPWYYSQINLDRIRIQDSQSQYKDKDEDFNPDAYYDAL